MKHELTIYHAIKIHSTTNSNYFYILSEDEKVIETWAYIWETIRHSDAAGAIDNFFDVVSIPTGDKIYMDDTKDEIIESTIDGDIKALTYCTGKTQLVKFYRTYIERF